MAEAIISRRYNGGNGTKPSVDTVLQTLTVTSNGTLAMPVCVNNLYTIRIFGGGGGGIQYSTGGGAGGGGWMNNNTISLAPGTNISIVIGKGGNGAIYGRKAESGGTTTFGVYLSANGGEGGTFDNGGNGGSGGGGSQYGGRGYQFGGGGGGFAGNGGDGGIWGGGGGGSGRLEFFRQSLGGTYGGNGGYGGFNVSDTDIAGENGTNTIGFISVPNNLQGYGIGGNTGRNSGGGGGGGYGGNGGSSTSTGSSYCNACSGGGGGYGPGGYGGSASAGSGTYNRFGCGGGGGGYNFHGMPSTWKGGGGGGGYSEHYATGGNSYNNSGTNYNENNINPDCTGKPGICIIQYYVEKQT